MRPRSSGHMEDPVHDAFLYMNCSNRSFFALQIGQTPGAASLAQR